MIQKSNTCAGLISAFSRSIKAFTLIELLVVVIIIAVLAAVAVPMYKRAVLKSRYSTLLPIAQHLKIAQETYYMGNDYYSDDLASLDLDVPGTITSATTANYGDGMRAQISNEDGREADYSYVLTSKSDLNNNYIMYQEHSKNYPGEIHCEAKEGDSDAQWLCEKGLQGRKIEKGSITPGYLTYVLSGTGNGSHLKQCNEEQEVQSACSGGCGVKTRSASCNDLTGQWEYGEWSSCPVQPATEKACEDGDTSLKQTRSVTCSSDGTTWETGEWDSSNCKKECDENQKPAVSQSCTTANRCGLETRTVSCNYSTGEWETGTWNKSACTAAPSGVSQPCDSPYTYGNKTATYTCQNNAWVAGWNTSSCGYTCDNGLKPTESADCSVVRGNSYCGTITYNVSCNHQDGTWIQTQSSYNCSKATTSQTKCGCDYNNPNAYMTNTTCNGSTSVSDDSACGGPSTGKAACTQQWLPSYSCVFDDYGAHCDVIHCSCWSGDAGDLD